LGIPMRSLLRAFTRFMEKANQANPSALALVATIGLILVSLTAISALAR